jgi:hypothetical protein
MAMSGIKRVVRNALNLAGLDVRRNPGMPMELSSQERAIITYVLQTASVIRAAGEGRT